MAALAILADGIDADRTREEWEVLFGSGPDPVDLTESGRLNESAAELGRELAEAYRAGGLGEEQVVQASAPDQLGRELWFLAHQVAQLARADEETAAGLRAEIAEFVRDHPRRFHEPVCAEFDARAVEPLWRALPGLVRGFVDQLDAWAS